MRTPVAAEAGIVTTLAMMRAPRPEPPDHPVMRRSASPGSSDMARKIPMSSRAKIAGTTVMANGAGPLKRPK